MKHSAHPRAIMSVLLALAFAALLPREVSAQAAAEAAAPSAPLTTAAAPEAPPPNAQADKKAEPTMICRTVRSTGSRLRKERVCTTKSTSKDAQDWLQRQQEKGAALNSDVPGGG